MMKIGLKKLIKKYGSGKSSSEPLITVSLSRSALLHNLSQFKTLCPNYKIAPVLKSNAYGHGLIEVARVLEDQADIFVIDSFFEAELLRSEGVPTPLLIMGYVRPETMRTHKLKGIHYGIASLEALKAIDFPAAIHLKIDTGMHRQGILPEEIDEALDFIQKNPLIKLEGLCSHFADAETEASRLTEHQIQVWNAAVEKVSTIFPSLPYLHISNTHGHLSAGRVTANTSRLGIGLYGLAYDMELDLRPVLSMETIISGTKTLQPGDTVGYGGTFTVPKSMTLATIPMGYYEGIDKELGNAGHVKVNGIFCPLIGRVSMNISTVDVTYAGECPIGTLVETISRNSDDKNSLVSISAITGKIVYELLVKIPAQLKRTVVS